MNVSSLNDFSLQRNPHGVVMSRNDAGRSDAFLADSAIRHTHCSDRPASEQWSKQGIRSKINAANRFDRWENQSTEGITNSNFRLFFHNLSDPSCSVGFGQENFFSSVRRERISLLRRFPLIRLDSYSATVTSPSLVMQPGVVSIKDSEMTYEDSIKDLLLTWDFSTYIGYSINCLNPQLINPEDKRGRI